MDKHTVEAWKGELLTSGSFSFMLDTFLDAESHTWLLNLSNTSVGFALEGKNLAWLSQSRLLENVS